MVVLARRSAKRNNLGLVTSYKEVGEGGARIIETENGTPGGGYVSTSMGNKVLEHN